MKQVCDFLKHKAGRLHTQLILFYIIMSFGVIFTIGMFSYIGIANIIKKQAEDLMFQTFQQSEFNIDSFLTEVENVAQKFKIEEGTLNFMEFQSISQVDSVEITKSLLRNMSGTISNYSYIDSIWLLRDDEIYFGTNSTFTWSSTEKLANEFYNSKTYQDARKNGSQVLWSGEFNKDDFSKREEDMGANLLTAACRVKRLYEGKNSATLLINMDEDKLNSIYNYAWNNSESNIYIVDSNGIVISNADKSRIGNKSDISFEELSPDRKYGRAVQTMNGVDTQIFYYQMEKTGWKIISEVSDAYFTKNLGGLLKIVIIAFLAILIIIIPVYSYWISKKLAPLKSLIAVMQKVGDGESGIVLQEIPNNEIGLLISQFNEMSISIKALLKSNHEMEKKKISLEIKNLQHQINPHFLFNTLNTVKWMGAIVRAGNIVDCLTALTNLLRPLYATSDIMYTIKEEFEYLKNYIVIMNYRYGNSVKFEFHVDESVMESRIMKFMLQPLVENAITHGLASTGQPGCITVDVTDESDGILFTVSDNGVGITQERLKEIRDKLDNPTEEQHPSNIGLQNVHQRMKLHFGEDSGISIESEVGKGTQIKLKIIRDSKEPTRETE